MDDKERFNKYIKEWEEYCKKPEIMLSSSMIEIMGCDSYRNLIAMGNTALPFIREAYDKLKADSIITLHGLPLLIHEIIGEEFSIPESIKGNLCEIRNYAKFWLDENLLDYISH